MMKVGIAVSALTLLCAAAQADTLTINFENYHTGSSSTWQTIDITSHGAKSGPGTGFDNSFNGTLDPGGHVLPQLFCYSLDQDFNHLPISFTVTVVSLTNSREVWTIDNARFQANVLALNPTAAQLDAGTQIAIWAEEYGTLGYNPSKTHDLVDITIAEDLLGDSLNKGANGFEYEYNGGSTGGQSMIGAPGPAALAPFAVGLVGLLRKRRAA